MNPVNQSGEHGAAESLPVTRWSVVKRAADDTREDQEQAMAWLFENYWQPLYLFLRREGRTREDAEDLLQEFFARMQNGRLLTVADPGRGRFRSILLRALRNLEVDFFRATRSQKRGAGAPVISMDTARAEEQLLAAPDNGLSPEMAYDRAWALTLLKRAEHRLGEACAAEGKSAHFSGLFPHVTGGPAAGNFAETAERLGLNEKAGRVALSRLRRRYAEAIRAEVAFTVGSKEEESDELRYLLENFS